MVIPIQILYFIRGMIRGNLHSIGIEPIIDDLENHYFIL
jgi:hypothetical protein